MRKNKCFRTNSRFINMPITQSLLSVIMSDDEMLKFEITDQDLDNEFNFSLRRPRMSKNQATYGIWAGNSDDEDPDARPSFSGSRGGKGNYSAPVNFVSAGIQKVTVFKQNLLFQTKNLTIFLNPRFRMKRKMKLNSKKNPRKKKFKREDLGIRSKVRKRKSLIIFAMIKARLLA